MAAALAGLGAGGRVYPLFMAGGWFTRVHLPAKLAEAGAVGWHVLEPFGCDPAVQDLAVTLALESGADEVILAAHGSFKSRAPSDVARRVAFGIAARGLPVRTGFIDQNPQLSTLTGAGPTAVCLPFFAAEGGHVTTDIPAALHAAGFKGRILPALGLDARVPGLIAAAIMADRPVCIAECRWVAA
jgi:sirohydrochlorin ferrochelatase